MLSLGIIHDDEAGADHLAMIIHCGSLQELHCVRVDHQTRSLHTKHPVDRQGHSNVLLIHWSPGNIEMIFKMQFSILFHWLVSDR